MKFLKNFIKIEGDASYREFCRNPKKISLTITKSSNINLIKGDISTLKSIPKSDLIIYAADKANLSKLKNHKNVNRKLRFILNKIR